MPKAQIAVQETVMNPDGKPVKMGNKEYLIIELPIARLKRFKAVFLDFFGDMSALLDKGNFSEEAVWTALFGLLEDKPAALVEIMIPGFDPALFDDEENGVTIPQLTHAIDLAISVNGLDILRRAVPFLASVAGPAAKLKVINAAMGQADDATEKMNLSES